MPGGKPRSYQPDELLQKYQEFIENKEHFPTVTSFCLYADIPRSSYYCYKDIDEYQDTIEKIEASLATFIDDQIMTARNPAGAIFMGKNKLGYSDKMEVKAETTINSDLQGLSKEELEEELQKLGYKKAREY